FSLGEGDEAAVFAYGNFIMALINFLIISWVVFLLVKMVNRIKYSVVNEKEPEPEAPAGPSETELLIEIRDALKAQK
ncbi:MAG: MscL family protein, partial [Roseobacter sp.]